MTIPIYPDKTRKNPIKSTTKWIGYVTIGSTTTIFPNLRNTKEEKRKLIDKLEYVSKTHIHTEFTDGGWCYQGERKGIVLEAGILPKRDFEHYSEKHYSIQQLTNPCKNPSFDINGLTLSYDGHSVITVTGPFERLPEGQHIRSYFGRSRPGSDWGADGIGYYVQEKAGRFSIHRSGVGPKKFKQGLEQLAAKGKIGKSYSSNPGEMKELNLVKFVKEAIFHYDQAENFIAKDELTKALLNYSTALTYLYIISDIGMEIIPTKDYTTLMNKFDEIMDKIDMLVKIEKVSKRVKFDGHSLQNPRSKKRRK
jgi:hypothetical protein